jgi:homoserine kinase
VLLIPSFEVRTSDARRVLPNEISRLGAIESCGNACLITAALASGDYEALRGAWGDQLHQPFRAEFVPFLDRVIAAAEQAGALGGFLSGSGSTIAAATLHAPEAIAAAMLRASGLAAAETRIVGADNDGVRIVISILAPDAPLA